MYEITATRRDGATVTIYIDNLEIGIARLEKIGSDWQEIAAKLIQGEN